MAKIVCMDVARVAWKKMKETLFNPFCFAKWLSLGICVWLASLLEGGFSFGNFNFRSPGHNGKSNNTKEFVAALDRIFNGDSGTFIDRIATETKIPANYFFWIIITVVAIIIITLIVSVVLFWLKSRFKFILIDNLIHNRTEIAQPWHEFKTMGNAIFGWYIIFTAASMILSLLCLFITGIGFLPWFKACLAARKFLSPETIQLTLMISGVSIMFAGSIAMTLIGFVFNQLVIPVIYWTHGGVIAAWRQTLALLKESLGGFVRFTCFYILFSLLAGIAVLIACLLTCCIGFLLLLIPVIGVTMILPIPVFFRFYALEFVAALGGQFHLPPPATTIETAS